MSKDTKQVLVMRREYIDDEGKKFKLRTGKLIAQGSHAAMAFLTRKLYNQRNISDKSTEYSFQLTNEEKNWIENSFAKVCVYVNSAEELEELALKAETEGLTVQRIVDSGRTEFHGVATPTCIAIGPHYVDKFEGITSGLPLL